MEVAARAAGELSRRPPDEATQGWSCPGRVPRVDDQIHTTAVDQNDSDTWSVAIVPNGWEGWAAAATVTAVIVAILAAFWTSHSVKRERQKLKIREIELQWFLGDLNQHRLEAERVLSRLDSRLNFKQIFALSGEASGPFTGPKCTNRSRGLTNQQYQSISAVLRFFYLIDSWRERKYIDEQEAIAVFGRSYVWWYWHQIRPRGKVLYLDPEWDFLRRFLPWLDDGYEELNPRMYKRMKCGAPDAAKCRESGCPKCGTA